MAHKHASSAAGAGVAASSVKAVTAGVSSGGSRDDENSGGRHLHKTSGRKKEN